MKVRKRIPSTPTVEQLKERPVLKLPYTRAEVVLEFAAVLVLLTMIALIALSWNDLPAQIPAHFGPAGQPDRWAAKEGIFTLPAIEVGLYLLFTLFFFFPNFLNYPWPITRKNAAPLYRLMRLLLGWVKTMMAWMFTYMIWTTIRVALHRAAGIQNGVSYIFLVAIIGGIVAFLVMANRVKD